MPSTSMPRAVTEPLGMSLGPAEDQGVAAALGLQDARHNFGFVEWVSPVDVLHNALDELAAVFVGIDGTNVRRLGHVSACERDDITGHGRREEHGLSIGRCEGNDALDIGQETHVQHLVSLVEDEYRCGAQVEVALFHQVKQPAGCSHHHVDAGFERFDLRLVRTPAVDG
jgi:hypothetical protein